MMTTPKTPVRAKVQRELSALAGEAHAIGLQMDQLRAQLEANQERVAKLADFLQTLAEFETPDAPGGRRAGFDFGAMAGPGAGASGGGLPSFAPPGATALPLAVPVHLGPADAASPAPASDPDAIRDAVARELADGTELSTRDLLERLRRQGHALPGREPLGELSAILSGSVAFRNEDRLWYLVNKTLPGRPLDVGAGRGGTAPVFGSSSLPGPTTP